jgi:hypothetical protein
MGQYHILINRDAGEHVFPHTLGNGLKAWEQTAGAIPAALVFLLAARPGNAPGDVGHHPLAGRWAGQRILAASDYAEDSDVPGFGRNPPLSCIYHLCTDQPDPAEQRTAYNKVTTTRSGKKIHRTVTPEMQYREELREFARLTRKYQHLPNLAPQLQGPIEHALSVRFVATSTRTFHDVPVKPFAVRKEDGELHYELPERLLRPQTGDDHWELGVIWRMCGLGGWRDNPAPDPLNLPEGLARWPWDRAPRDMTFHNATDADQDLGQQRVYANLDRREFFDPGVFGEVPTTLGLMRAAATFPPPMTMSGRHAQNLDGGWNSARPPAYGPRCCIRSRAAAATLSAPNFPRLGAGVTIVCCSLQSTMITARTCRPRVLFGNPSAIYPPRYLPLPRRRREPWVADARRWSSAF